MAEERRAHVIRLIGPALEGLTTRHDGRYLVDCNVNGYEQGDVTKLVESTALISEARLFSTVKEAFDYWQRQSSLVPLRFDGKPNRPLTAYTISVDPVFVGETNQ